MESELEAFAERVRRKAVKILALAKRDPEHVQEVAAELIVEAARIAEGKKMTREVSEPDRYDLSALPTPTIREDEEPE